MFFQNVLQSPDLIMWCGLLKFPILFIVLSCYISWDCESTVQKCGKLFPFWGSHNSDLAWDDLITPQVQVNKENSIEFLLFSVYYLYNYYMVCALLSHTHHVTVTPVIFHRLRVEFEPLGNLDENKPDFLNQICVNYFFSGREGWPIWWETQEFVMRPLNVDMKM